ncbi:MAG: ATP-binding protein [Kiritimatiellae bacterium]|nr:ATP-binding protein [Kiritimatiellia bacterium]
MNDSTFTIAVASGKGGTGKTTVAVNIAAVLADRKIPVQYLDCDVEEPNGHIFLKPEIQRSETVTMKVPVIDAARCTGCRECAKACQFNAIAVPKRAMVFTELCHGCGACTLACPEGAITETDENIGVVESGNSGDILFGQGRLRVGISITPPIVRAVKRTRQAGAVVLLDSAPGTACPVVAAVRDVDYVILVTEPTPFGLNDLRLAVELMRELGRPFGVVINRAGIGNDEVKDFCEAEKIPLLAELPDDRRVAEAYSRGELLITVPGFKKSLQSLGDKIMQEAGR